MTLWVNGALADGDAARIAPDDRGFLLGDGVFDTFRIRDGAPAHLPAHLARLRASAAVFGLPIPYSDETLEDAARQVAEATGQGAGVARLTVSRGAGPRGLNPPDPAAALVMLGVAPVARAADRLRLIVSDVTRPALALTSRHKTLSYIGSVEARRRAALAGCDEALMLNERGEIVCAAAANVFWIAGGTLHTPPLACGALDGIVRARVLAQAQAAGLETRERAAPPHALRTARTLFVTNSAIGVAPVAALVTAAGEWRFDVDDPALATLRRAAD